MDSPKILEAKMLYFYGLILLNLLAIKYKGLEELINTDVKFIINSDAHELYQIGNVDYAFNLVKKYHIEDRVVNLGHSEFPLRSKS